MARWVLLGIEDPDVDVLTRLPKPHPDVLVVHPDPEALVLQLASLAEMDTATEAPEPRSDDILVTPAEEGALLEEWVAGWRKAGATILTADAVEASLEPAAGEPPGPPPAGARAESKADPVKLPDTSSVTRKDANGDDPVPADPPPEIWARPEDTFKYLIEESLGGGSVTLWWDGDADVWVPWVWTGPEPVGEAEDLGDRGDIPSSYGRFKLVAPPEVEGRLNLAALARVAEDMALRDLAVWNRLRAELMELSPPSASGDLEAWSRPVLDALDPETALVWSRGDTGWSLVLTWGDGVRFEGEFLLSDHLLSEMFAGSDLDWHRWDPVDGVCVQIAVARDDPRWELRSSRVMDALKRRVGGR